MTTPQPLDERGLPEGYAFRPEWERTPRQVQAMRDAGQPMVLIDCRTPQEHAVARIEPAVLLPLQQAADRLAELEPYRDQPVVVVCHHGLRSLQMAWLLRQRGFRDVTSMAGGIDLWSQDIDPAVPRY